MCRILGILAPLSLMCDYDRNLSSITRYGKSVEHGRQVAGEVGDAAGGRVVYLDPALDLAEEVVAYVVVRELGPGWVVERSRRDHGAITVMNCSSRSQTSVLPG